MLSSFVLSFFSLGGAGRIIGSIGGTDAVHSPPIASLSFINSSCSCEHLDQLSKLHQIPAPQPFLACACFSGEKY